MHCVILAAGGSTRLRPLTDTTPKCMLDINGTPILGHLLTDLLPLPIRRFTIVVGFKGEQIREYVRDAFERFPVTFVENTDYATTNNAYSLLLAQDAVMDDELLLLDSDILFDKRILPLLLTSIHPNALVVRTEGSFGKEEIKVQCSNSAYKISAIGKEVPLGSTYGESIGIEKFSIPATKALFETLHRRIAGEKRTNEFYEASFQELIDLGIPLHAVNAGGYKCIEIDTPEDLAAARELFRS